MGEIDISSLFKEFEVVDVINEADYKEVMPMIKSLKALSRISPQSFYIVDYYRKNYMYVSPNPLFLCNYSADEVQQMGADFYSKVVTPEDLEMLMEINEKGFELFYHYPVDMRLGLSCSYDFRIIRSNLKKIMVNLKFTPISLSPGGNIWLALCLITLSSSKNPGNVMMKNEYDLKRYHYSFENKQWLESEIPTLTAREKDVLTLAAQGYSNNDIVKTLFIDLNTVKTHKKNIFQKLNVKNVSEAVAFAYNNKLIF